MTETNFLRFSALVCGAGAMLLAVSTPAAAQVRWLAVGSGQWNLDYGDIRCSLSRRLAGPQSPILILSSYLGRDEPEILLIQDGSEAMPALPSRPEVILQPANALARGRLQQNRARNMRFATIADLGEGFIERFAQSQSIQIRSGERVLVDMRIPGAARAVAALKACNDDLLRSWGIDVAANARLSRQPRQVRGEISWTDYPDAALRANASGRVVVRFTINPDGRISDCRPVASSGSAALDGRVCPLMVERFRYEPGLDAANAAVAVGAVTTVSWYLPP